MAEYLARMALRFARAAAPPHGRVPGVLRDPASDFCLRVPFHVHSAASASPLRVAMACHIYYLDVVGEMRAAAANIPGSVDLFITTDTEAKQAAIARQFEGWSKGKCIVRLVANRGRDIAPKLTAFGDVYVGYDLILHLHSKRSTSTVDGAAWRRYLIQSLAGTPAIAGSILDAFAADASIGMIGPQHWQPIRNWVDWGQNFPAARAMARRMGLRLTPAHSIDFPSGSMFWARPAAMRPLLDLGLLPEAFPDELGQYEGTVAHAIERLFYFSCEAAGLRWLKVCAAGAPETRVRTELSLGSAGDLADFHRRFGFRLTGARLHSA